MAKSRSKKNEAYKSQNRAVRNKERKQLKLIKKLEQRKSWRLKKFGEVPPEKMSGTTRKLFKKRNHRKEEIVRYEINRIKGTPSPFKTYWG